MKDSPWKKKFAQYSQQRLNNRSAYLVKRLADFNRSIEEAKEAIDAMRADEDLKNNIKKSKSDTKNASNTQQKVDDTNNKSTSVRKDNDKNKATVKNTEKKGSKDVLNEVDRMANILSPFFTEFESDFPEYKPYQKKLKKDRVKETLSEDTDRNKGKSPSLIADEEAGKQVDRKLSVINASILSLENTLKTNTLMTPLQMYATNIQLSKLNEDRDKLLQQRSELKERFNLLFNPNEISANRVVSLMTDPEINKNYNNLKKINDDISTRLEKVYNQLKKLKDENNSFASIFESAETRKNRNDKIQYYEKLNDKLKLQQDNIREQITRQNINLNKVHDYIAANGWNPNTVPNDIKKIIQKNTPYLLTNEGASELRDIASHVSNVNLKAKDSLVSANAKEVMNPKVSSDELRKQKTELESRLEAKKFEIEQTHGKDLDRMQKTGIASSVFSANPNDLRNAYRNEFDKDYALYLKALDKVNKALEYSEISEKIAKDAWYLSAGRGFGLAGKDVDLYTSGMAGFSDALTLKGISDKLKSGEAITDGEQRVLNAQAMMNIAQSNMDSNANMWFKGGETFAQSIPFMIDFIVGSKGLNALARGASKGFMSSFARYLSGQAAKNEMARAAFKVAQDYGTAGVKNILRRYAAQAPGFVKLMAADAVYSGILSNTLQAGKTARDVLKEQIGTVDYDIDPLQGIVAKGFKDQKSFADALYTAEARAWTENFSEMMGEWGIGSLLKKTGLGIFTKTIGVKNVAKLGEKWSSFADMVGTGITRITPNKARLLATITGTYLKNGMFKNIKANELLESAQWHGFFGECAEEYYGMILNHALGVQESDNSLFQDLTDPKLFWDIATGIGLSTFFLGAGGLIHYAHANNKYNKADAQGKAVFGEDWDKYRNAIVLSDYSNLGQVMANLVESTTDKNKKKALVDFHKSLMEMRATSLSMNEEYAKQQKHAHILARDRAFMSGYGETDLVKKDDVERSIEILEQRINDETNLGDKYDDIGIALLHYGTIDDLIEEEGLNEEQAALIKAYDNMVSSNMGMDQRSIDDLQDALTQAKQHVQNITHENDNIIQVKTKDGELLYLTKGTFAREVDDKGKYTGKIDKTRSAKQFIAKTEQGSSRKVDIDDIESIVDIRSQVEQLLFTGNFIRQQYKASNDRYRQNGIDVGDKHKLENGEELTIIGSSRDGGILYSVSNNETGTEVINHAQNPQEMWDIVNDIKHKRQEKLIQQHIQLAKEESNQNNEGSAEEAKAVEEQNNKELEDLNKQRDEETANKKAGEYIPSGKNDKTSSDGVAKDRVNKALKNMPKRVTYDEFKAILSKHGVQVPYIYDGRLRKLFNAFQKGNITKDQFAQAFTRKGLDIDLDEDGNIKKEVKKKPYVTPISTKILKKELESPTSEKIVPEQPKKPYVSPTSEKIEEPKKEHHYIVSDDDLSDYLSLAASLLGIKKNLIQEDDEMKLIPILTKIGIGLVERGVYKLLDYAGFMVQNLGDTVRPYIQQAYSGLKYSPRLTKEQRDKLDSEETIAKFDPDLFDKEQVQVPEELKNEPAPTALQGDEDNHKDNPVETAYKELEKHILKQEESVQRDMTTGQHYFIKIANRLAMFTRVHGWKKSAWTKSFVNSDKQKDIFNKLNEARKNNNLIEAIKSYNNPELESYITYLQQGGTDIDEVIRGISEILSNSTNISVKYGTYIDNIARLFFNGAIIDYTTFKYDDGVLLKDTMSKTVFEALIKHLENVKEQLKDYTIITKNIVFYSTFIDPVTNKEVRIAGETDMIAIDKHGNYIILDFKTHRNSKSYQWDGTKYGNLYEVSDYTFPDGSKQVISQGDDYTTQLSIYAEMVEDDCNSMKVTGLQLIPFKLFYDNKSSHVYFDRIDLENLIPLTRADNLFERVQQQNGKISEEELKEAANKFKSELTKKVEAIIKYMQHIFNKIESVEDGVIPDYIVEELSDYPNRLQEHRDQTIEKIRNAADTATVNLIIRDIIQTFDSWGIELQNIDELVTRNIDEFERMRREEAEAVSDIDNQPDPNVVVGVSEKTKQPITQNKVDDLLDDENPEEWKKHNVTWKSTKEDSLGIEDACAVNPDGTLDKTKMLKQVTTEPDFINEATFLFIMKKARGYDRIHVVITYKGVTYQPVSVSNSQSSYYSMVKSKVLSTFDNPDLMVCPTVVRRTRGRIRERLSGKTLIFTSLVDSGLVSTKRGLGSNYIYDIEYSQNQDVFGRTIRYNNSTTKAECPGHVLYEYTDKSDNTHMPSGVVVMMIDRQYEELLSGSRMRTPITLQASHITEGDAKLILDILKGEYGTLDEEHVESGKGCGLTNRDLLNLLIPTTPTDENGNARLHLSFNETGDAVSGNYKISDIKIEGAFENIDLTSVPINVDSQSNIEAAVKFLTNHVRKNIDFTTMSVRLGRLNDNNSQPQCHLTRIRKAAFLLGIKSTLKPGEIIKFGNSSIQFDVTDFHDPSNPQDLNGLSGLGWYIKHGFLEVSYDGFENALLEFGNDVEIRDKKQTIPQDSNTESPVALQDLDDDPIQLQAALEQARIQSLNEIDPDDISGLLSTGRRGKKFHKPLNMELAIQRLRRIVGEHVPISVIETMIKLRGRAKAFGLCTALGISLSSKAEQGTEYHEGFHWVTELVIDQEKRKKIYKKFANGNHNKHNKKQRAGLTEKQLAEAMADQFWYFMEENPDVKISWNLKEMFQSIKEWVKFYNSIGSYTLYRYYCEVSSGKYADLMPSDENIERFEQFAKNGLPYEVNGIDFDNAYCDYQIQDLVDSLAYFFVADVQGKTQNINYATGANAKDIKLDLETLKNSAVLKQWLEIVKDNPATYNLLQEALEEDKFKALLPMIESTVNRLLTDFADLQEEENNQKKEGNDTGNALSRETETKDSEDEFVESSLGSQLEYSEDRSLFSRASSQVKFFFAGVDSRKTNSLGLPVMYSSKRIMNEVINEVWNCDSVGDIAKKLKTLAQKYYKYDVIYRRYMQLMNAAYGKTQDGRLYTKNDNYAAQLTLIYNILKSTKNDFGVAKTKRVAGGTTVRIYTKNTHEAQRYVEDWSDLFAAGYNKYIKVGEDGRLVMRGKYSPKIFQKIYEFLFGTPTFATQERAKGNMDTLMGLAYAFSEEGINAHQDPNKPHCILNKKVKKDGKEINVPVDIDVNNPEHLLLAKYKFLECLNSIGITFDMEMLDYMLDHKYKSIGSEAFGRLLTGTTGDATDNGISGLATLINNMAIVKDGKYYINQNEDGTKLAEFELNKIFNNNAFVKELANYKYLYIHSTQELGELTANDKRQYNITQNNTITDTMHKACKDDLFRRQLLSVKYIFDQTQGLGSIIAKLIFRGDLMKMNFVNLSGIKSDDSRDKDADYDKMSSRDDYISKMEALQLGHLLLPTLSDKKTFGWIEGVYVPGIDWSYNPKYQAYVFNNVNQVLPNGKLEYDINGNVEIPINDAVLTQILEYCITENNAIADNLKLIPNTPEEKRVPNFHGQKVFVKDGKVSMKKPKNSEGWEKKIVLNGARFSGLTGVYISEDTKDGRFKAGEYVSFTNLIDENGNYVDEQTAWQLAQEVFFSKEPADQKKMIQTILNKELRSELDKVERVGLVESIASNKSDDLYKYRNKGLDMNKVAALDAILASAIPDPLERQSLAVAIMINDSMCRSIISNMEFERIFSGSPQYFKWAWDSDGILIDKTSDQSKRFGGLSSTGVNNNTSIPEIDSTKEYICAEVNNEFCASPQFEKITQMMHDGELKRAYLQKILNENGITFDNANDPIIQEKVDEIDKMSIDEIKSKLDPQTVEVVEKIAKQKSDDFADDIDVNDGAAYMSDKMAENLLRMCGEFTSDVSTAFKILRGEEVNGKVYTQEQILSDAYNLVLTKVIGNLKYSAYGFRFRDGLAIPYYDKMALFPVFKMISFGKFGKIYEMMNNQENEDGTKGIDMIMVNSAVKVGSEGSKDIDYNDPEFKLHTYRERYENIRKQFNTDPKEKELMAMGTQMTKVALSVLMPMRNYIVNGQKMSATEIRNGIMENINKLSELGKQKIENMFYDIEKDEKTGLVLSKTFNINKFSELLQKELTGRGADASTVDSVSVVERNGKKELKIPLVAHSNMNWIQSILVSMINKRVIDINLPGEAFIQRSIWGMEGENTIIDDDMLQPLNGGKDLEMINEEGSMDCVLSIDFYEPILKKVKVKTGRKIEKLDKNGKPVTRKKFLKSDGSTIDPYEVFATIYEMYPNIKSSLEDARERSGKENDTLESFWGTTTDTDEDLIGKSKNDFYNEALRYLGVSEDRVVEEKVMVDEYVSLSERSFTELKQWLLDHNIIGQGATANMVSYRIPTQAVSSIHPLRCVDVLPVVRHTVMLPKEFTKITGSDFDIDKLYISMKHYNNQGNTEFEEGTEEYHANQLLDLYIAALKDQDWSCASLNGSIDKDTDLLKDIVKDLENDVKANELKAFHNYTLSFQSNVRGEFITGKIGLGPFALNNTNHILTMLYNIRFRSGLSGYLSLLGRESLAESTDRYGNSIMSWLSGLINAHVDVAKDSYISRLGVNGYTYNLTNLLVRTGFGKDTFYLLTQPIMKQFAVAHKNASGVYMTDTTIPQYKQQENAIKNVVINTINAYYNSHAIEVKDESGKLKKPPFLLIDSKNPYGQYKEAVNYFLEDMKSKGIETEKVIQQLMSKNDGTLREISKWYINNHDEADFTEYDKTFKVGEYGLNTFEIQMFVSILNEDLQKYAQSMSDLVKYSKIDTKKQGKNLVEQLDYKYNVRRVFEENTAFEDEGIYNLYNSSYVKTKTENAINSFSDLMLNQSLEATGRFQNEVLDIIAKLERNFNKKLFSKVSKQLLTYIKSMFFFGEDGYCSKHNIKPYELICGNNTIYDRLLHIKGMLYTESKYQDVKDGLIDERGNIRNYLLNVLVRDYKDELAWDGMSLGSIASKYKGAKFIKILDNINDEPLDVNQVKIAWRQLLEDTKFQELQLFARDLVVYAFMVSGDNGGANDLFKYVPEAWKLGFNEAGYEDSYVNYMSKVLQNYQNGIGFSIDYDDLFLNNWNDDDFIPTVNYASFTTVMNYDEGGYPVVLAGYSAQADAKSGEEIVSISRYTKPFVKVPRMHGENAHVEGSRNYVVYKYIGNGIYTTSKKDVKTGKVVQEQHEYPIYVQLDAKGEQFTGRRRIYEMGRIDGTQSEAAENMLRSSKTKIDFTKIWKYFQRENLEFIYKDFRDVVLTFAQDLLDKNRIGPFKAFYKEMGFSDELYNVVIGKARKIYKDRKMEQDETANDNPSKNQNGYSSRYYEGRVSPGPNTVFVFGSNPEGIHGAGAARTASVDFGAQRGVGEGMTGNAYALPTKDLQKAKGTRWYRPGKQEESDVKEWYKTHDYSEVKNHPLNNERTISPESIIESIKKLYQIARENPNKQFKVSNYPLGELSLNGYLGEEMIAMFNQAGDIPSNIIFSKEWFDSGMLNLGMLKQQVGPKIKINIYAGTNENADLSNFAERPFEYTSVGDFNVKTRFRTVEGAFLAQKLNFTEKYDIDLIIELEERLANATGSEARAIGRSIKGLDKETWDEKSSSIMKKLLSTSFEQNPQALQRLLDTGNATLTHTQDKGKWGTEFPKLLMEVREELRSLNQSSIEKMSSEYERFVQENSNWDDEFDDKVMNRCKG